MATKEADFGSSQEQEERCFDCVKYDERLGLNCPNYEICTLANQPPTES